MEALIKILLACAISTAFVIVVLSVFALITMISGNFGAGVGMLSFFWLGSVGIIWICMLD
jgi:hypothetical protein